MFRGKPKICRRLHAAPRPGLLPLRSGCAGPPALAVQPASTRNRSTIAARQTGGGTRWEARFESQADLGAAVASGRCYFRPASSSEPPSLDPRHCARRSFADLRALGADQLRAPLDYRCVPDQRLKQYLQQAAGRLFEMRLATAFSSLLDRISAVDGIQCDRVLPYGTAADPEPGTPPAGNADEDGILLVAHVSASGLGSPASSGGYVSLSTGFLVLDNTTLVTVHHTFEQFKRSNHPPSSQITTVALSSFGDVYPVQDVATSWTEHDVVVLKLGKPLAFANATGTYEQPSRPLRPLPVSPFPPPVESNVRAHVYPAGSWVDCKVLGYRDPIGCRAATGTYDYLSRMDISLVVSPGSSGGPIVDESGGVVGILRGNILVSSTAAAKGHAFALPAERLFELFQFPC